MNTDMTTSREELQVLRQTIERNLRLMMEPAQVHEIRVLGISGRGGVDSGYFNDPAKAASAVMSYDGRSKGIYVTLNPVAPTLLARGNNRMVGYAKETTRDEEVIHRRWLMLDFDPMRPAGISSSDEEHLAAVDVAHRCRLRLSDLGWAEPIVASSGNGSHLLYRIDLPSDDAAKQLIKSCLRTVRMELTTESVDIDISVSNAAQLTKVYGTMACKGDSLPDRPHRRSQVLTLPKELIVVDRIALQRLAELGQLQQAPRRTAESLSTKRASEPDEAPTPSTGEYSAYAEKALSSELAHVRTAPQGNRNDQLNKSAYSLGQLVGAGVLDEEIVRSELADAAATAGLERSETTVTIRSGLAAGMASPRVLPEPKEYPVATSAGSHLLNETAHTAPSASLQQMDDVRIVTLDELILRLKAVPVAANGKAEQELLEEEALSVIDLACQLCSADMLRLTTELKRLGTTAKFAEDFGKAVRATRKELEAQQIVSDDDIPKPEGYPYSAEYGQTFLLGIETTKNKETVIKRQATIADFEAQIVEEAVSEDGRRNFVIEGNTSEYMKFRLEIGAEEFADERTLKAKLTSAAGARAPIHAGMQRHVGPAIQTLSDPDIPTITAYERTGWANGRFLIPGRKADGVRISLPTKLAFNVSSRELEQGIECLDYLLTALKPTNITPLLAYVLQAPLAYLAGWREERYALFIRGTSGSLKTSVAQLMMTMYGCRFHNDESLIKWGEGSTRNALMTLASHAHDLPLLIDNYKPTTGGGAKDFINFIHNVMEGGDKDRLTRFSQLREARAVNCWPLLTGEDLPDGDPASLARILVVQFRPNSINTSHLSEAQSRADHLQAVGYSWIEWLETTEGRERAQWAKEEFPSRRDWWVAYLQKQNKDAVNPMRVASNLASNQLTLQVATYHPILGPIVSPYIADHLIGLEELAGAMAQATGQGLEAQRFLSHLRELLTSGRCLLVPKGETAKLGDEDRMLGWESTDGIYLLPDIAQQAVVRLSGDEALRSLTRSTLYRQLQELGMIASSNLDRNTTQIWHDGVKTTTVHLRREALFDDQLAPCAERED